MGAVLYWGPKKGPYFRELPKYEASGCGLSVWAPLSTAWGGVEVPGDGLPERTYGVMLLRAV